MRGGGKTGNREARRGGKESGKRGEKQEKEVREDIEEKGERTMKRKDRREEKARELCVPSDLGMVKHTAQCVMPNNTAIHPLYLVKEHLVKKRASMSRDLSGFSGARPSALVSV